MSTEELAEKLLEKLKEENKDIFENNYVDLEHWRGIGVVQLYIALANYLQ